MKAVTTSLSLACDVIELKLISDEVIKMLYVPDSGAAQDQVDDGDVDGGDGGSVGVLDDHQQRHRLLFGKQVCGPQG